MKLLSLFSFIAFLFLTEGARKFCPREKCVPHRQCPHLSNALRSRIPHLQQLARDAICGYQGVHAKVCCEELSGAPDPPPQPQVCQRDQHGNTHCPRRSEYHGQDGSNLLPEVCGQVAGFSRIFGGRHAELGAYPWIVAMKYTNPLDNGTQVLCSGTLINERYVVTAAHCLDENVTGWKLTSLLLGEWRLSTDPDCSYPTVCAPPALEVRAERVLPHPSFNKEFRLSDDIGLIRLDRAVPFTRFAQPMCLPPFILPHEEVGLGTPVTALGWGQWEEKDVSDILREVQLRIMTPVLCHRYFPSFFRINRAQLCLGDTGGVDTCSGDSGGPVIQMGSSGSYYLLAISSLGHTDCGGESVPAVYTSVAHYASWIRASLSP